MCTIPLLCLCVYFFLCVCVCKCVSLCMCVCVCVCVGKRSDKFATSVQSIVAMVEWSHFLKTFYNFLEISYQNMKDVKAFHLESKG